MPCRILYVFGIAYKKRNSSMKTVLSILFIFFIAPAYSQLGKTIDIPTYPNYSNKPDTSLWYKSKCDLENRINLKDLLYYTDTFHFRFWTDNQAIDIWTSNYTRYFGMVTNFAQRYDDKLLRKGVYKIGKVYSNQVMLDSTKVKQVIDKLNELSIVAVPSDNKIAGWASGLDGVEFLIETSTPNEYIFKTYWSPKVFADTLKEARQIQAFVDFLQNDFKMYMYYEKLKLPAGSYQSNGMRSIRIRTKNEFVPGATKVTDLL